MSNRRIPAAGEAAPQTAGNRGTEAHLRCRNAFQPPREAGPETASKAHLRKTCFSRYDSSLRRCLVLAVCVMTSGASAGAQAPPAQGGAPQPSTTRMVLKGKAPVSNEVLKVKLPRPQEADLANGLHLIVLEDRRLPQIAFQIIIPGAGGYFDPADKIGLATYAAQLMREGTRTRTSPQISETLETMSATLNVGSGLSGPSASVSGSSRARASSGRIGTFAAGS